MNRCIMMAGGIYGCIYTILRSSSGFVPPQKPHFTACKCCFVQSYIYNYDLDACYNSTLNTTMAERDKKFQFRAKKFRAQNCRLNSFQSTKLQTEIISEHKISH